MKLIVSACALLVLLTCPAWTQLNPKLQRPIVEKQTKIRAQVYDKGKWAVEVWDGATPPVRKGVKEVEIANSDTGLLVFDFSDEPDIKGTGVKKDWTVRLFKGAAPAVAPAATAVDVVTVQANAVSIFLTPPKEGDQVVKGTVFGTADKVRVEVFNPGGSPVDFDTASVTPGDTANPGSQFTAGMNRRLTAGETVRITALVGDSEVGATTDFALVDTVEFNWGRVRAYFTLGATVAQQEKTTTKDGKTTRDRPFGSADYYVSMAVDYNWLTNLQNRFAAPCQRPAKAVEELIQLEDLVDQWDGVDFKRRLGNISDPSARFARGQAAVAQFKAVLAKAITDLQTRTGENCLAVEEARVGMLAATEKQLPEGMLSEITVYEAAPAALAEALESARIEQGKILDEQKLLDDRKDSDAQAKLVERAQAVKLKIKAAQDAFDTALKSAQVAALAREAKIKEAIGRLDNDLEEFRRGDPTEPRGGWMFNTSFESRLGQAPVAGGAAPAEGSPATPTAPATIVQSPNSGFVGVDLYMPHWTRRTAWRFEEKDYALFVAPIAKFGLLATSNGPVAIADSKEDPALFRHLYGTHSYGVRFGHYALAERSRTVAPELISFLDITYGKFENFRHISGAGPSTTDHVPWRTEFHGRFRVPETPIYVGFTANVGPGRDDMRFFFGTRFDFSKLISKLVPAP